MTLIRGKCATICTLFRRPQRKVIVPDSNKLVMKFPITTAFEKSPKESAEETNITLNWVLGSILGTFIMIWVPNGMNLRLLLEKKYFSSRIVALSLSRLRPAEI